MYQIGQAVQIQGTFEDAAGAAADPTTITCKVRQPNGTVTTVATTKAGTGIYTANVTPDVAGRWYYRFIGTGTVTAQRESFFLVEEASVV